MNPIPFPDPSAFCYTEDYGGVDCRGCEVLSSVDADRDDDHYEFHHFLEGAWESHGVSTPTSRQQAEEAQNPH